MRNKEKLLRYTLEIAEDLQARGIINLIKISVCLSDPTLHVIYLKIIPFIDSELHE